MRHLPLHRAIAVLIVGLAGISIGTLPIGNAGRTVQSALATVPVSATVETTPVPHSGDAADDPAIWIHPSDPSQSTVLGTDKLGGLAVYDLAGKQLQYLADGAINNVDLRYNFPLGGQPVALVTAGKTSNNSLAIYRVDPATRQLVNVAARTITPGISIYGSCMYHSPTSGKYYVFLDAKNGSVEQWELFATSSGRVDATRVRSFNVGSQVEGCVADDETQAFYISEESVGIWRYGAEPGAGTTRTQVDTTSAGGHVASHVEGLAIYYASGGGGYLIASSQGSDEFTIYQRGDNAYVGTFAIAAGGGIDRVSNTDGIDVTNFGLGGAFAQGMFVAQDGSNDSGNQNFKLVPWQAIASAFTPPLTIDTSWDPRLIGGSPPATSTPTAAPDGTPSPTSTATPAATATPPPTTFAFSPDADTYVSQSAPTTSYASNSQLQAVGGSAVKQVFLRFTVSGLPSGAVVSLAKLRLTVVNDSKAGGLFYRMTNTTWAENVTWNTRPAADGPLLASLGTVALSAVIEVNVTAAVTGNGSYSFAIVAPASSTDTVAYASRQASTLSTRPQLIVATQSATPATPISTPTATPTSTAISQATATNTPTPAATATNTPTPAATATSTVTPTATQSPPPSPTATNTPTPGATATASATPTASSTRIKDITFEGGSLTGSPSGADSVVGSVLRETSQPLKGIYSARIANAGSSYLQEDFTTADDLFVSFYLRLKALPGAEVRIALISNAGTTVGNLYLRPSGALRLRNGSTTVGADTAPLALDQLYRVGLRQKRGSGANGVLEAYLATGDAAFGAPFAALSNGSWTTPADRLRAGATISVALDAIIDDIRLDSGAMP